MGTISKSKVQTLRVKSHDEIKSLFEKESNLLFHSSKTSTVISYDLLEQSSDQAVINLVDLSGLPKKVVVDSVTKSVRVTGPVTWSELIHELTPHGLRVKCWPTEDSACVLAGLATSATGEYAFGYGPLRDHVLSLNGIDGRGEDFSFKREDRIPFLSDDELKKYQKEFKPYQSFKNAPFPRFSCGVDTLIGTEGQFGVITEAVLEVTEQRATECFFFQLSSWRNDSQHLVKLTESIQKFRHQVIAVELIDSEGLKLAEIEEFDANKDLVVLEVFADEMDIFLEEFLELNQYIDPESVFQISFSKWSEVRKKVPRQINEWLSRNQLKKKGTDIQIQLSEFADLLGSYQNLARKFADVESTLFGHLGDCHLHFNFMPASDQHAKIEESFKKLYRKYRTKNISPFAEHGLGILKTPFIADFVPDQVLDIYWKLKKQFDPENRFFPLGLSRLSSKK